MVEGVVRVGDTVRRPRDTASHLMREVLLHLERVGFDAAPRWLGVDEQGRDILTLYQPQPDGSAMKPILLCTVR
jgi:hypothetical protein